MQGGRKRITLEVEIMGESYTALVDSGSMANFISANVINGKRLPWKKKKSPYPLFSGEGKPFHYNKGIIDMETDHLTSTILGREMEITYNMMDITSDIILGHPWFEEYNPQFDWTIGQLEWKPSIPGGPKELRILQEAEFRDDLATTPPKKEKRTKLRRPRKAKADVLTEKATQPGIRHKQTDFKQRKVLAFIRKEVTNINQEMKTSPIEERTKHIPTEFRKYKKLFQEELETGLPEHSNMDHVIQLVDRTTPTFSPIYGLNLKEIEVLREYL